MRHSDTGDGGDGSRPFGAALRWRRQQRGLSLRGLARRVAYSPGWLSKVENGVGAPTEQLARACERELGVDGELTALVRAPHPERQRPVRPAQLPAGPGRFVGRAAELRALEALLSRPYAPSTVTIAAIDGAPGTGKSALALHWAHRIADAFPDGVLFADLRGHAPDAAPADPAEVLEGFLTALGVPEGALPTGVEQRSALLRSLLADRCVLIVLDDVADSRQVESLLPGTAGNGNGNGNGNTVVATSRRRLAGLAVRAGAVRMSLGPMAPQESFELVRSVVDVDRVRREPEGVHDLARRCAHLPLALRTAAEQLATSPHRTVAGLVDELGDDRRRLDLLANGDDARLTLRSAFERSYRTLDGEAARAFRLIALHPGEDFGVAAAAALIGRSTSHTRRLVERLESAHLLEESGADRYGLDTLLRSYALQRAGEEESPTAHLAAVRRLADWYAHTIDVANLVLAPNRLIEPLGLAPVDVEPLDFRTAREAVDWCSAEEANFVPLARMAARHRLPAAWHIPARLWNWILLRKPWSVWIESHQTGLEAARLAGDEEGQAWVAVNLGEAYRQSGDPDRARALYGQALTVRRRLGDRHGQAWALAGLGFLAADEGDPDGCCGYFARALSLFEEVSDRQGRAAALTSLAEAHGRRARVEEALRGFEAALELFAEMGDRYGEGWCLSKLADVHRQWGDLERSVDCFERSVAARRAAGDTWGEAEALSRCGNVLAVLGGDRRHRARRSWERAYEIFDGLADPRALDVWERMRDSRDDAGAPR